MVQIRIMTDKRERGERVAEILLPLLQSCTALHVGEPTELRHRSGGLRLVLDVQAATNATSVHITREDAPAPRRQTGRRRRALPPG